jgi:RNA polymerase sigma-70 factor (ECF subfamily)
MDGRQEMDRIAAACRGDLLAFNQLVLDYQELLYNHACLLLGSQTAAEDVTQDAFLQAFQKLGQYRGGSFHAWLLRILTNLCYDEIRRRERHPVQTFSTLLNWFYDEDPEPLEWVLSPGPSVEELVERQEPKFQQHLDRCPAISAPQSCWSTYSN